MNPNANLHTHLNKIKPDGLDVLDRRTVLEEVGHQLMRLVVTKLATPHTLDVEDVVPVTGSSRNGIRRSRQCLGKHFGVLEFPQGGVGIYRAVGPCRDWRIVGQSVQFESVVNHFFTFLQIKNLKPFKLKSKQI